SLSSMALVFILSSTGEPSGSRAGPAITLISSLCWCAASPQAVWCVRLPRGALAVHTRQTADEATGSWYALRDISKTSPLVYTATASGFWTAPGRFIGHISSYPQNGGLWAFARGIAPHGAYHRVLNAGQRDGLRTRCRRGKSHSKGSVQRNSTP